MTREYYILDDSTLRELADGTPCTEGGSISDFMDEIRVAKKAVAETGATPRNERARLLLLMWSIYFLGVLRGGEEYRNQLLVREELLAPGAERSDFTPIPFELSKSCAQMFADDLDDLPLSELNKLWALCN